MAIAKNALGMLLTTGNNLPTTIGGMATAAVAGVADAGKSAVNSQYHFLATASVYF